MFSEEVRKVVKRLQTARLLLMTKQPFYAVLLLHMKFSLDPMCETAYTDGERIAFCPDFINALSDNELEFVLMHEVLHVALDHCGRTHRDYDVDDFNTACDVVVNSNILHSCGMDVSRITLKDFGESMHLAPDGKEGFNYTAEEVYGMLCAKKCVMQSGKNICGGGDEEGDGDGSGKADGAKEGGGEGKGNGGGGRIGARSDGGFDDHTFWDQGDGGKEGDGADMRAVWLQRMIEATQIASSIEEYQNKKGSTSCGNVPLGVKRMIEEFTEPQTDWRTVLDTFIQEEITDYSFNLPDRRFEDSPFLLPDFNEKEESVEDVLFMIDTSGSMSDDMITQAYSEIYGAIQQFGGRLKGWLGFFDAEVVEPTEFCDEEEFKVIKAKGGGGTSFYCIFKYVEENIDKIKPSSIVILTDGYAPFPEEEAAMDIPVLWVINNESADPPWGKVTRIKIE